MNGLVDDWMSGQGAEGEEQEQDQGARAREERERSRSPSVGDLFRELLERFCRIGHCVFDSREIGRERMSLFEKARGLFGLRHNAGNSNAWDTLCLADRRQLPYPFSHQG